MQCIVKFIRFTDDKDIRKILKDSVDDFDLVAVAMNPLKIK